MATSPSFNWPEPDNTDLVKNGALAIRTAVDAIDTSMTDLLGGTTGQVLTKASGTDMDFTWGAGATVPDSYGYTAGKNKIINGDFRVWQRGTSFTTSASEAYTSDRWVQYSNGSMTTSQQTFTPGTAPVAGYEGTFFQRLTTSASGVSASFRQKIEDVRTFAGQTVTLSFWIKASGAFTATPMIRQNFGSGGSSSVDTNNGTVSVTTSWVRVTKTITVPSISGKTIGTSNCLEVFLYQFSDTIPTSGTIDIWGVQLEAGSSATTFQTATGSIQGELAACQRYAIVYGEVDLRGMASGASTLARMSIGFPVEMRVVPSVSMTGTYSWYDGTTVGTFTSISGFNATVDSFAIDANAATGTTVTSRPVGVIKQAQNGTLTVSAEL
jgi:hypothetical protein